MARFEFRLPDIGEGIAQAEIVAWHVAVGDTIEEDQALADMMTDKATVEMESPVTGTVVSLAGSIGDQVAIGSTLVVIDTEYESVEISTEVIENGKAIVNRAAVEAPIEKSGSNPRVPSTEQQPSNSENTHSSAFEEAAEKPAAYENSVIEDNTQRVRASPAVRARAQNLGVDLSAVKFDGPHMRHADLDAYLSYSGSQGYHGPNASQSREDVPVKIIGMRRRIAENMAASKRSIPHFTYVDEIDVTALEDMRAKLNTSRGHRPKLTMLPLLIAAICRSIPQFPMLNARYDDEAGVVTRHGRVHFGVATQTDKGLMVPVIRDAQDKNLWQLANEIARLADAARSGKATLDELSGSTLTVTSLGPLGGIATTPVINRPEVAIIGPNKIVERPVFKRNALGGNDIAIAKLMNLSISCDHRVVDGWDAASFVQAVKRLLETPVLLFAEDIP